MKLIAEKHNTSRTSHDGLDICIIEDPEVCPECGTRTITLDQDKCEEYCTQCGYITRAATRYVAGNKIDLPYGLIII